jgi:hypothetical protein
MWAAWAAAIAMLLGRPGPRRWTIRAGWVLIAAMLLVYIRTAYVFFAFHDGWRQMAEHNLFARLFSS